MSCRKGALAPAVWSLLLTTLWVPGLTGQVPTTVTSEIYDAAGAAVVLIETDTTVGAGFILNAAGRVVTTAAILESAGEIIARVSSGEVFDRVRVIALDPRRNIAVLEIPALGPSDVRLGNSDSVLPRTSLVVLGVSLGSSGFRPSISEGRVSEIRMEPAGFTTFQVRAALSGEDAGSPVLTREGEIIGIVSSPPSDGGLVPVIPINYLRRLIPQ